jgi:hypothetical protein
MTMAWNGQAWNGQALYFIKKTFKITFLEAFDHIDKLAFFK